MSDIRNGYLTVKRSKNSLHTEQALHAHANPLFDTPAVLAAWLAERSKQCSLDDNPYLFTKERRRIVSAAAMAKRQSGDYSRQQIYKDMRETMLVAGIDSRRAHPHTIKHTTAAHAIRAGIDIAYVKELLGHKHFSSTVQYLHISQEDAAAKQNKAMQNAFGAL